MTLADEIRRAISRLSPDPDELAYLALTSKPEAQVRDRLAYQLHQQLADRDLMVAREWKRTDLAILRSDGAPEALLEAKALLSPHATRDPHLRNWRERVRSDIRKARRTAERVDTADAEIFALVIVTHVCTPVRVDQRSAIKYGRRLTDVAKWDEVERNLGQLLPEAEAPYVRKLGRGVAFGIEVEVWTWLFGPVEPVPEAGSDESGLEKKPRDGDEIFPFEDVEACRADERLQDENALGKLDSDMKAELEAMRREALQRGAPQAAQWIYFSSPEWSWENLCGREGWLLYDEATQTQHAFFETAIS